MDLFSIFIIICLNCIYVVCDSPELVPIDDHIVQQFSVNFGDGKNTTSSCIGCNCGVGNVSFKAKPPAGWNLTALNFVVEGDLHHDPVRISFNGAKLAVLTKRKSSSSCKCTNNSVINFDTSSQVTLPSHMLNLFLYADNNTIAIEVDPGKHGCASIVHVNATFTNLGPYIELVQPVMGPSTGHTDLLLLGVNLRSTDYPKCQFGSTLVDAHPVPGPFPNSALRCKTPPQTLTSALKQMPVTIVPSNRHWPYPPSPPLYYYYYAPAVVESIAPVSGAPDAATNVVVSGDRFLSETPRLVCRFGNITVDAEFQNSKKIRCWAPPLTKQIEQDTTVPFSISLNGQDFTHSKLNFTYVAAASRLIMLRDQLEAILVIVSACLLSVFVCLAVSVYRQRRLRQINERRKRRQRAIAGESGYSSEMFDTQRAYDPSRAAVRALADKRFDASELRMVERIGKGSFGEVWLALWRGTNVAVKKLPASFLSDPASVEEFKREGQLLRRLRHPNILQFIGATAMEKDVLLIVEYMSRGSLHDLLHRSLQKSKKSESSEETDDNDDNDKANEKTPLIAHQDNKNVLLGRSDVETITDEHNNNSSATKKLAFFPLQRRLAMLCDAARGVLYLHGCKPTVVHRDLKPRNLLVAADWRVKICDFGLSTVVSQSKGTMTACGTPAYTAPEIIRNFKYNEKADVYSFGIILWETYTRLTPYKGMPPFQIVFAVGTQSMRPPAPAPSCPQELWLLIQDCWCEDMELRPSFEQVLQRLSGLTRQFDNEDDQ